MEAWGLALAMVLVQASVLMQALDLGQESPALPELAQRRTCE